MDLKALTRLAKTCRKLGINQFTCPEFSFSLSDREPVKRLVKVQPKKKSELQEALDAMNEEIPGDMPSAEDLLFYSAGQMPNEEIEIK